MEGHPAPSSDAAGQRPGDGPAGPGDALPAQPGQRGPGLGFRWTSAILPGGGSPERSGRSGSSGPGGSGTRDRGDDLRPPTEGARLMRRVGATLFLLLIVIYWGIGLNFSFAYTLANEQQNDLTLLNYLWELPAIGIPLAVAIPLWLLRPVARDYNRMLRGQPLEDPAKSLDRILRYPRRIVWYFTPASIAAYLLGSVSILWVARTPFDEFLKGVPLGLPLGLLFSLASYIVLVHYLEPVRRLFVQRHGYGPAQRPITSVYRKVVVTSITIVSLSLGLLFLIAYAQGQMILEEQLHARMEDKLRDEAQEGWLHPGNPAFAKALDELELGERGYAFVVDGSGAVVGEHPRGAGSLADEGWDEAQVAAALGPELGRFTDRIDIVRLVAFTPVAGTEQHIVVVTYRDDFAAPLGTMSWAMLAATVLGIVVAAGLTFTGARAITKPVQELTEAMRRAREGDDGSRVTLITDDEVGALAGSYDLMMQRLREKSRALEDSVVRLREMDATKTRFINIASHELRTPMTPIRTELHLIRTGKRGPLTPEQERGLQMISRNTDRLNRLIRDLLEATRMQAGQFRVSPRSVPLEDVVQTALHTMHEEAKRKGVELSADLQLPEPGRVLADEDRLAQVLINLLENAIQFTPAGGQVRVLATRRGTEAAVEVRDTGAGIDPAVIARLFQPFSQAEPGVPRTEGGTGLGLYICRGIVEQHGGRIVCSSEGPGKGASFAFTVPLAPAPEAAEGPADPFGRAPAPAQQAGEPARVL